MPHGAAMPAPHPLLVDAAGHTCVAWWHAPAPAVDARLAPALPRGWLPGGPLPLAVVLASSWGEEDMSAYDGQRALAMRLAESGLGTLRFEWPDTGDSSADTGTTSIADALAAFDAAARQALALSGCERLAFVGLRLGALLAAHAAAARDDVEALVALMPVASGRVFVREQRVPAAELAAPEPTPAPGVAFDAAELPVLLGGFAQPVRRLEAVAALKWPATLRPALRDALLLWRPETPSRGAADALAGAGVRVSEWAHAGLASALAAAHQARLAPEAIDEIARWLQERAEDAVPARPGLRSNGVAADEPRSHGVVAAAARLDAATGTVLALSAADARAWMHLRHAGTAVRERVVRIGTPGDVAAPCLVGVLTQRGSTDAAAATRSPRRGIVLLSSGRDRRVGPHRLWVPFARHRAAHGDVVLRVDIAGIGDSSPHMRREADHTARLDDPRAVDDIARALAWLRREHGVGPCTVMGICSGASNLWRATLAGLDVQHAVMLNPGTFHFAPTRQADPAEGRARHALRMRLREIARCVRWPLEHDLAADLARVCGQGVALDFVFSSREPGLARWREEAGRRGLRLVRDSRVKLCVIDRADSTFAGTAGRAELYARLDALLQPAAPLMHPPADASPRQAATVRS